ncbi:MAG: thioredoxin domain-containing protein [Intrasporangium sp.]|uniref:thioredoxin domain-containing protein n=1 Tax=Intrasporangium sp. TaxID=1925024 RepID=UPI002647FC0D|nr:thioredoxin domain-containing protein [Intrasporangium sp.]MDN5794201.1 thioredoxin domain-containing protein [Intrasporangium sp.]
MGSNRLASATSPYLRQHADNPVHWQEWRAAAFAEARERNVPILLSIGYAACHWCHVMAHESFEDDTVAAVLNERFVSIKVDREERPDIDAVYMVATTATTGSGGWPMTCFLTPEADPFFCGTYLPREQLLRLLAAIDEAWRTREAEVRASGTHIASSLAAATTAPGAAPVDEPVLATAVAQLATSFDDRDAGFGTAPKFPPSMVLEFLLRHHARTGTPMALEMAERTLEAMARGGIYDQLGGGFARYAVDAGWVVPHFEKMLYDNALLLRVYLHWWKATGSPLALRVVEETAEFLLTDLRTEEGGFAASLDADTQGQEGLTYAWTPGQIVEVLGRADGDLAADLLGVTASGTFERGTSTLRLIADPAAPQWFSTVRARLKQARDGRPQPARDDKVVTSWNGLAIAALADAGAVAGRPEWVAAARACADLVLGRHLVDGRLRRSSLARTVGEAAGVADDYGNLAEGLLALHQATGEVRWFEAAGDLLERALSRFAAGDGGFHDTASDAERLYLRPRSGADNAEPSGQSALAGALVTYGALAGSSVHLEAGRRAVAAAGSLAGRDPRFAGWTLAVAEALTSGPLEVAVVGSDDVAAQMNRLVRACTSPGLVLAAGAPDSPGVPLLAGRPLVDGGSAAYVCRGFVCDAPITDVAALARALAAGRPR